MVEWTAEYKQEYMKKYGKEYYKKHKEQWKIYAKNRKESQRKYRIKNLRTRYIGYGGACFCPKCGKWGYKMYHAHVNMKTGTSQPFTQVQHQHSENGKTVHDGACYIGMGKL